MKTISVLIPCYNEEENVEPIARAVTEILEKELPQYDYELVFIDNDSQDDNTDGWDDDYWDDDGWDDDSWDDDNDNIDDWDTDDDWEEDVTLALTDISVNPKSKIIKKGKVFYIEIVPANKNDWVSSDEWEEVCGDNIASVEFTSTKSSIVSASKFNGKIKGKKKGTAIIKTKITLINNESIVLKTKVTVKK